MTETSKPVTPEDATRLMRLSVQASVVVAIVLIAAKLVAWFYSGSLSLLATLVDSCLDLLAALFSLVAVKRALSPADAHYRFGHGKFEPLTGLVQAAFLAGSALFLLFEGIRRIMSPEPLAAFGLGIGIMIFAIAVTGGLWLFQRYVTSRTGSVAMQAASLHYRADLIVSLSVIASLVLSAIGLRFFDTLFALGIAAYILYGVWEIVLQSSQQLLDRELPDSQREDITRLALQHNKVLGMRDLRTRRSGLTAFMQLHIELEDELTLLQAHRVGDEVESSLRERFPDAEIMIRFDAASAVRDLPKDEQSI
ncbi:MAG: cation diffusion facilitator family transporter [Pseudomonadota bacterium]